MLAQDLPGGGSCALFCNACEGAPEGQNWKYGAGAGNGPHLQYCHRGSCVGCVPLQGATDSPAEGAIEALKNLRQMSAIDRASVIGRLVIDAERGRIFELSACSSSRIVRAAKISDIDAAAALRFGAQTFARWSEESKRVLALERR